MQTKPVHVMRNRVLEWTRGEESPSVRFMGMECVRHAFEPTLSVCFTCRAKDWIGMGAIRNRFWLSPLRYL